MTLVLIVLVLLIVVNCIFMGYFIADVTRKREKKEPGNPIALGVITFFQFILSNFGISDYAIGASVYTKLKWVPAKKMPGTVNVAAAIPIAVMALIYISSIEIDLPTLIVPIAAQVLGSFLLAKYVAVKMPVRTIRIFLALGMIATVWRIAAENLGFFPDAGTINSLSLGKLIFLGILCFIYGALNDTGFGSFAPTMVTVYAMGLSAQAAFPIIMGACAFSLPVASIQFIKHGAYSRKVAVVSAVIGTLGVLASHFLMSGWDFTIIKWLMAAFLLYSVCNIIFSVIKNKDDVTVEPKIKKEKTRMSTIGILTSLCVTVILICTISLLVVFIINSQVIASRNLATRIGESNTRVRDSVHAYLHEHESIILGARAAVAYFMTNEPVNIEELHRFLHDTASIRDDINTLFCSTNEVWNRPGGYAVFSDEWEIPQDWDNTERPWFAAAKEAQGAISFSRPYRDMLTGNIVVDMSVNIYDRNGNDIGVFSNSITIDAINAMLEDAISEEGQRVFLIDREGYFIVHRNIAFAGQNNFFAEADYLKYKDKILTSDYFSTIGSEYALYSSSIEDADWYVISIIPTRSLYYTINRQIIEIFMSQLLTIFFMLFSVLICLIILIRRESHDKIIAEKVSEELKLANKAKSSFLSTMSHEIRTPMNAILGITEIQLNNPMLENNVKEALERIYASGDLLLGIINDILDLSKIEAGKLEFVIAEYEIASLLSDTAQLNMMRIGSKPIEFELYVNENTPTTFLGDELRVKQILNNLLSNAFKYTDKGTVSLHVDYCEENSSSVLIFKVSDTGQGMTPEQVSRLGDEFARFNMEANRKTEGTGLGMNITRNLIQMMNGEIKIESEFGKGSVFTVRLPQEKAGDTVLGAEMVENLLKFRTTSKSQMKRAQVVYEPMPYGKILIVDDVEMNIYVAKGLLVPYRLNIDSAQSGFEAIEKIKSGNVYDIIFMDHMMPEMDGIETTKHIRETGYTEPIVALTANAVAGQAEIFLGNGFDDFISKPIDVRQMNMILHKFIHDKQPPEVIQAARQQVIDEEIENYRRRSSGEPEEISKDDNTSIYTEAFLRDAAKSIAALESINYDNETDFTDDNLRKFIIHVHGMKSALANLGEMELSATAMKLEALGREKNLNVIISEAPVFIESLKKLTEKLTPKEETETVNLTEKDLDHLKKQLAEIKTLCNNYDESEIEEILTALREKQWTKQIKDLLSSISGHLLHSDFEHIAEIIEEFEG